MKDLVRDFTRHYFENHEHTWSNTYWMGVKLFKCPLDLWVYQEILFDLKPDWIIETGTKYGGSALFLAHMCDIINKGKIITIDINDEIRARHRRVTYMKGSSTHPRIVKNVKKFVRGTVLLILDSDHRAGHVLRELNAYNDVSSYIIVEDTALGYTVKRKGYPPGPKVAVDRFLEENSEWTIDKDKNKFMLSFNPDGYLCKS